VTFPFNYFIVAFAGAFATSLLALPLWRKWCLHTGLVDDPGHRKIHDAPIPLAGGLAVLTGILLPLGAGAILLKLGVVKVSSASAIIHGLDRRALELAVIALGAVAITILGWLDDRHELKALPKFIGQIIIAIVVAAACKRITLFIHSEAFSYAITILWLLTVINAFNFMDNMNGLCAGVGAIGALNFSLIAAAKGEYLVAITGFLMCGALVGFLPWNFRRLPARGDGDSAAFLHPAGTASSGRARAAARACHSPARSRAGQHVPHVEQKTVLDWRHQSSFAPARARRPEPHLGGAGSLARRRRPRRARLLAVSKRR
jgi:hypothetical protein